MIYNIPPRCLSFIKFPFQNCSLFPIWNHSVFPCPVLTVTSSPAYIFLRRQVRLAWYSHLLKNFPHIQTPVINHNGKEYEKKYIYICMCRYIYIYITEFLCCIIELNTSINQLYINKVIFFIKVAWPTDLPALSCPQSFPVLLTSLCVPLNPVANLFLSPPPSASSRHGFLASYDPTYSCKRILPNIFVLEEY